MGNPELHAKGGRLLRQLPAPGDVQVDFLKDLFGNIETRDVPRPIFYRVPNTEY